MSDTRSIRETYDRLCEVIRPRKAAALAVSGGVDSLLLLDAAREALSGAVMALTATGPLFDVGEAARVAGEAGRLGVKHREIFFDPFSHPELVNNRPDRCYICKWSLFGTILDGKTTRRTAGANERIQELTNHTRYASK